MGGPCTLFPTPLLVSDLLGQRGTPAVSAGLVSAVSCHLLSPHRHLLAAGEGLEQRHDGSNMLPSVGIDDCTLSWAENFFRK